MFKAGVLEKSRTLSFFVREICMLSNERKCLHMKKLLGKIVCRIGAKLSGNFIMEVPGIPDTRLGVRMFKKGLKMQGINFNDWINMKTK